MYELAIPGFVAFAAATTAEFPFAAVQCVSIRLLMTSPMGMLTARATAQSNRNSRY